MPYNLNMENIIIHDKTCDMLLSISSTILHVRYSEHANSKSVQSSPIWRYVLCLPILTDLMFGKSIYHQTLDVIEIVVNTNMQKYILALYTWQSHLQLYSICLLRFCRLQLVSLYIDWYLAIPSMKLKGSILVSPYLSTHLWTKSCLLCIFYNTRQIHYIFTHLIK